MQYKEITDLIRKDFDKSRTVMLHGTSVESLVNLFEKDVFNNPSVRRILRRRKKTHKHHPYMFFAPHNVFFRSSRQKVSKFLKLSQCTFEDALHHARNYAFFNAVDHFALNKLGFIPQTVAELTLQPYSKMIDMFFIPELEKKGYSEKFISSFILSARKKRGVVLGINQEALELDIEKGKDDAWNEVCIHLPRGLHKKYINAIVPQSPYENRFLRQYLVSRLLTAQSSLINH